MKKLVSFISIFIFYFQAISKTVPEAPNPPRLVNDFAKILNSNDINFLEQKLKIFNDSTSTQIAIVIENSIEDDDVFDYSFRLAQKWGIGQKGKNNGVLIYTAIAERKIRIQVGYGLEGVLTDAACKEIIETIIKPSFKQGNYFAGYDAATSRIIAITKGEYKAEAKNEKGINPAFIIIIFIIIYIIFTIINKGGGGKTYSSSGSDWWTAAMIGSAMSNGRRSGGSSWGDFSSGSGSFGGFGGGSFGGGGAGGDW